MFDPQVQSLNSILTIEQLRRFQSRSLNYQSDTESVRRSFDELESTGYLIQAVPEELGGLGLSFSEICQQQVQLARYSPADASAVGTHICWTGAAADAWRMGDTSLE